MTVALFGGTFNPVHNAHLALAEATLRAGLVDEVWLLVTPQNPWKRHADLAPDADRLAMARLAVEAHAASPRKPLCGGRQTAAIVASDYEFRLPTPTYTYLTLRALCRDYPQTEFRLLIGGDNYAAFDRWAHYDEILARHRLIVYPRGAWADSPRELDTRGLAAHAPGKPLILAAPQIDISSTAIRRRLALGQSIAGLTPQPVIDYIHAQHLYTP